MVTTEPLDARIKKGIDTAGLSLRLSFFLNQPGVVRWSDTLNYLSSCHGIKQWSSLFAHLLSMIGRRRELIDNSLHLQRLYKRSCTLSSRAPYLLVSRISKVLGQSIKIS